MRPVRIATTSFLVDEEVHPLERNFERCVDYIGEARKETADIICFPENVATINVAPELRGAAEKYPGIFTNFFRNAAKEFRINIIAPYLVRVGRRTYSQATVIDRKGRVVGCYRKIQPTAEELEYVTPGNTLPVFKLDIGRIAVMLCLDIHYPEIARIYARKGAEIIFWPTVSYGPTEESLLTQLRARAIDNSIIVVEANLAGHPPYAPYAGRHRPATGRIVDHNGDIVARTGRRHGVAVARLDLDEVRLTSGCVLRREPDRIREDLLEIMRVDLYAREYQRMLKGGKQKTENRKRKTENRNSS